MNLDVEPDLSFIALQSRPPIIETVAVVVAAVALGIVVWYLGKRLQSRLQDEDIEVARAALLLVLTGAATVLLLLVWNATDDALSLIGILEFSIEAGIRVAFTVFLFVVAHAITRVLKRLLVGARNSRTKLTSDHQRRISFFVSQIAIYIFAIFAVLSLWGVELNDLLVGAGVLGIVLGFAAQKTLGSILAGFILMISRPFSVGDWVLIGDQEGFVTEITINNVRLRNLDGEYVVIPNEAVNNQTTINRSVEGKLRLRVEVGIDYEADPEHAEAVALEAMSTLDEIMSQPEPQAIPVRFGDSAVVLELRFWVDQPRPARKWRAIQAVIHAVKKAFKREGIKIPFPQRELVGRSEAGGFHVVGNQPDTRSSSRMGAPK